jgi:hypothetical protein
MSDDVDIRKILMAVADITGRDLSETAIDLYVEALKGIPPDRLQRAAALCLARSTFLPTPVELLEANAQIPLTAEEQQRAREKLLERIEWNPKQLRSATEAFLEHVNPTKESPRQPKTADDLEAAVKRIAESKTIATSPGEWEKRLAELRQQAAALLEVQRAKEPKT